MKKILLALTLFAAGGCIATPRKITRAPEDRLYQVRPRGSAWEARDEGGQTYALQSLDLRALPDVDEHMLGAKQVAGWTWVEGRVRPFPSWHGKGPGFVLSVTEVLPGPPTATATATAPPPEPPDALVVPSAVAEDGGVVHPWTVKPNGKVCIAAPCPSWTATATDGSGRTAEITDVDLSALGLTGAKLEAMRKDVLRGATSVKGVIRTAPKAGPAGDGIVLVVQP